MYAIRSYYDIYAKFAIASGNNKLTIKTRSFGSNYTYFKLTAIKEDGTVTYISPSSNTATAASAASVITSYSIHYTKLYD